MTLNSSEKKNFLSWWITTILKSFLDSSASCHSTLPLFIWPMSRMHKIVPKILPFLSRIQSLHHLLEVDHHDESDMRISSWLSKGKGKGKDVQGEGKGKDGKNESFKKAKSDTQRKCFYCNKSGLACPKYLAAQCCGSAFPENGLASLQDHDKVEVTLVDWERGIVHCVLIQLPENLSNHSYNWLHSVVPEFWPWIH